MYGWCWVKLENEDLRRFSLSILGIRYLGFISFLVFLCIWFILWFWLNYFIIVFVVLNCFEIILIKMLVVYYILRKEDF